MSQEIVTYSLDSPQHPTYVTRKMSSQEVAILPLTGVLLESISTRRVSPVQIVNGVIRVNEDLMEDGEPYTFQYQRKEHMITRVDGKIKLYKLR